jgi:hypothetical protein
VADSRGGRQPPPSTAHAGSGGAKEAFYWAGSYGRGVGIAAHSDCASGQQLDGSTCYTNCRDGYKGVGPVCWEDKASYGRGAGSVPKVTTHCHGVKCETKSDCHSSQDKDAGLCYTKCRDGYHGSGPTCNSNAAASYGRGAGKVAKLDCNSNREIDAGLCYTRCRDGYHGVAPVCWANTPPGYLTCGAGYAATGNDCSLVVAAQGVAVTFAAAAGANLEAATASRTAMLVAKIAAKRMRPAEVQALTKAGADTLVDLLPTVKNVAKSILKDPESPEAAIGVVKGSFKLDGASGKRMQTFLDRATESGLIEKGVLAGWSGYGVASDSGGPKAIDEVRVIANVAGLAMGLLDMGPGPTSPEMKAFKPIWPVAEQAVSLLGAFAYPVYGEK